MKTATEACATCGSPAAPGQEYCLECGSRIVRARRFSAVGRAWERRLGRYPGDWIWAALLLGLVAAGSATAGIAASRNTTAGSASRTIVATSPVVIAPPAPPAPPTTTRTATVTTPPATTTTATKPTSGLALWPARNGYTVVLASIPARSSGLADADAKARQALGHGLREVGVLTSGDFASLHPGYYVVFAGVFDTLDEAQTAVRRDASRYPNAYARPISR